MIVMSPIEDTKYVICSQWSHHWISRWKW